jgi:uncharacterized membrane protein YcaP (DUF421 family)
MMQKFNSLLSFIAVFFTTAGNLNAQIKSGTAEVSKTLKKAVYGGTYSLTNGNIGVFFQEKDELAAYEFDSNAQYVVTHNGSEANNLLNKANHQESTVTKQINASEISDGMGLKIMYPKESWGSLKLVNGLIYLSSTDKFINGFELEEKDTRKLKIEGTWRTNNIGARAIIPEGKTYYKFKAQNGRFMSFDLAKTAIPIVPVNGYLQSAGIITEKISISNPSPHNANRLVIFKIGFDNQETNNIHIMPYSMRGIGVGSDAQGNMTVLTVPLNAPSTYGPHKKLNAKDEERGFLYLYRFDQDNNLIDEQKIKSDLNNVNSYQTIVAGNKTFLVGTGKTDGKGFISSYPGQKTDAVSIALLDENGKLSPFKTYSEKELISKLETNGAKSNMKFTGGPYFYSASILDNGNVFLMGKSDGWHHGILLSTNGELIRYYIFTHLDLTKNKIYTEQLHVKGNNIFVLLADQPHELTNEKQTSTSSSSSTHSMGGGYALKTTTTSTQTRQLFEIFHLSNVFVIDGNTGNAAKIELSKEVKNFYTLGDTPALFTDDAIYIPGRIKANKGKEVSLIKIIIKH